MPMPFDLPPLHILALDRPRITSRRLCCCTVAAGKGMHSRLYKRVLNKHAWVSNATAFSTLYNDTGLAGIHITTNSRHIDHGIEIAIEELQV